MARSADSDVRPPANGAAIELLRSIVLRGRTAQLIESHLRTTLLRSIVDATVAIFEAEAASIALYRAESDSLEFVIASGAQGEGVVGLTIPSHQGIAGYAFTLGEPIAMGEAERDSRFDRQLSAGTGYVPRSILAVPMRSEGRTIGVLEVLDKRVGAFSMRDVELAGVFADQAAVAIQIGARVLEVEAVLRDVLVDGIDGTDRRELESVVSAATRARSGDDRFWDYVDAIVGLRAARPDERALAVEVLDVVARRAAAARRTFGRAR